jgi:hypothetical protein
MVRSGCVPICLLRFILGCDGVTLFFSSDSATEKYIRAFLMAVGMDWRARAE